ncbi:MAG: hypothetical protein RIT81_44095 [Deltaproteobacteria bacterium]
MKKLAVLLLMSLAACATDVRRFPLADPLWIDEDQNHVPEKPSDYYSGLMADGADMMAFYPLSRMWTFPLDDEAANANALDEVPNSSWFTNRIGLHPVTPEEAALGACNGQPKLDPADGKWIVSGAKPNGANPGFFIKAPNGQRYLLKFDGPQQPPRATSADVIGSKLYWTAGFFTPCNQVVYFPETIFEIDPEATAENAFGEKQPITDADIDKTLSKAFRLKDGRLRASASQFVPGRPIGPFTYQGTRGDDPNDIIPHEDRRELRGSYVFAAWINHFDSREQNTLDVWAKDGGREFIRHYIIDWGDSFGSRWPHDQISRRLGLSYYFDFQHVFLDLITFGLIPRAWNRSEVSAEEIFGYYNVEQFDPVDYRPGYPNPAFDARQPRDLMWAIRVLARFTPEHLRAIIAQGKLPDPRQERELYRVLRGRQLKLIESVVTKYSPLTNFKLVRRKADSKRQSLCFEDIALQYGVVSSTVATYKMRFMGGEAADEELGWLQFRPDSDHPHRSCAALPIGHRRPADLVDASAPDDDPMRYGIMRIFVHQTRSVLPTSETRVHVYDLGPERGFKIVGIEHPTNATRPDVY